MNDKISKKNTIATNTVVWEAHDSVQTKYGQGTVTRLWITNPEYNELIGYQVVLKRKITGGIHIKLTDAIVSAELEYSRTLNKIKEELNV